MSTTNAVAPLAQDIERALIGGDLARLTPEQRMSYYNSVCESIGLNPLTKPFEYLVLNGKTILYAKKDATDQLRTIHNISLQIISREVTEGIYVVTARAIRSDGRQDESIGALPLPGSPLERSNAIMKAETKAKRRVTLSICGLGWLDETETETIPGVHQGTREDQRAVAQQRIEELSKPKQIAEAADRIEAILDKDLAEPFVRAAAEQRITEAAAMLETPPAVEVTVQAPAPRQSKEQKAFQQEYLTLPPDLRAMVDKFQVIKKDLKKITGSDDKYREILGNNGHEKTTQIRFAEEGERIYQEMKQAFVDAMDLATKSKPELMQKLGEVLTK